MTTRERRHVKPAVNLSAQTIVDDRLAVDMARELDAAGFGGIAISGFGGNLAYAVSLAHRTSAIPVFTCVQPIYLAHPLEVARQARHVRAFAGERFTLGLGVSHKPVLDSAGIQSRGPIDAMRRYVQDVRDAGYDGRIYLAGVQRRMIGLAYEVADGVILAHAARSRIRPLLTSAGRRSDDGFTVGNVIATAICADPGEARAAVRGYLAKVYVKLPNYRAAWRVAGFGDEVDEIERGIATGDDAVVLRGISDRLIAECCLACTPAELRVEVERWIDAGVDVPILQLVAQPDSPYEQAAELLRVYR